MSSCSSSASARFSLLDMSVLKVMPKVTLVCVGFMLRQSPYHMVMGLVAASVHHARTIHHGKDMAPRKDVRCWPRRRISEPVARHMRLDHDALATRAARGL